MKKVFFILFFCICPITLLRAQTIAGKIINEKKEPVAYANIILLDQKDSTFIEGTTSDGNGDFSLNRGNSNKYLIKVSSIGYITQFVHYHNDTKLTIMLKESDKILNDVVVKGHRPVSYLTTEGLLTHVRGTVLEKIGTAEDVLKFIPGLLASNGSYEVFGRGAPIIYINGRLLHDQTELDRIKSEDIVSVELITNPGARYAASVQAVLKIKTKKVQGEGLGTDLRSAYSQGIYSNFEEQVSWNYHHRKFDAFGTFYFAKGKNKDISTITQDVRVDTLWHQDNYQAHRYINRTLKESIGLDYMFNEENSIGAWYTITLNPDGSNHTTFNSDISANGTYFDKLKDRIDATVYYRPSHLLNMYYHGKIGVTELDFDADYLFDKDGNNTKTAEISESQENRTVTSESKERNILFASKLILSHPLLGGKVSIGAEYTKTKRNDDYINNENYVPLSLSMLRNQNESAFMVYNIPSKIGSFMAGLRYEHASFDYYENHQLVKEQSRNFSNLFPSFSYNKSFGNFHLLTGYTLKTSRPSYHQLSNNVTYINRYMVQSGNPLLDNEIIHHISFQGLWKFIQLDLGYNDRRNAIIYWTVQEGERTSVTRLTYTNVKSLKDFSAFLSITPQIGIWYGQFNAGIVKQWLHLDASTDRQVMNRPVFVSTINSIFKFPHEWNLSCDMTYQSKGDDENNYLLRSYFVGNAGIVKTWFKDKISLKLSVSDMFHSAKYGELMYCNRFQSSQISRSDSRNISLTFRYKFNIVPNKYKGTGAGNDEKSRL